MPLAVDVRCAIRFAPSLVAPPRSRVWVGEGVPVYLFFRDALGARVAPANVRLTARRPDGLTLIWQGADLQTGQVGDFSAILSAELVGDYLLRASCEGPQPAADEARITVISSLQWSVPVGPPLIVTADLGPLITQSGGLLTVRRITSLPLRLGFDGTETLPIVAGDESYSATFAGLRDAVVSSAAPGIGEAVSDATAAAATSAEQAEQSATAAGSSSAQADAAMEAAADSATDAATSATSAGAAATNSGAARDAAAASRDDAAASQLSASTSATAAGVARDAAVMARTAADASALAAGVAASAATVRAPTLAALQAISPSQQETPGEVYADGASNGAYRWRGSAWVRVSTQTVPALQARVDLLEGTVQGGYESLGGPAILVTAPGADGLPRELARWNSQGELELPTARVGTLYATTIVNAVLTALGVQVTANTAAAAANALAIASAAAAVNPAYQTLDPANDPLMAFTAPGADGALRILGQVTQGNVLTWDAMATKSLALPRLTAGDGTLYGYETLEPGDLFLTDSTGRIVTAYLRPGDNLTGLAITNGRLVFSRRDGTTADIGAVGGNSPSATAFDTLEPGNAFLTDADGRLLGVVPSKNLDAYTAEIDSARGATSSLAARVANIVDASGQPIAASWGLWRLRQTRWKLRCCAVGNVNANAAQPNTFTHNMIGDSYTYLGHFADPYARSMRMLAGDAGGGFLNVRTPYNRPCPVIGEYTTTLAGIWTDVPSAVPTPDRGYAEATAAGAKVTLTTTVARAPTLMRLFYVPTSDGQARYRWNGGAWSALDLTVGSGAATIDLAGLPTLAATFTLEVEWVAGTVRLAGFDVRYGGNGFRLNKFGQNGSAAAQWGGGTSNATWKAIAATFDCDLVSIMHSANDQPSQTPAQIAANLLLIATNCRGIWPAADVLIVQEPENHLGRATSMASITAAVRAMCVANKLPFLDTQYVFGDVPAEYSPTSVHNWLPDNIHPGADQGGFVMGDAYYRAITQGF